jgi:hypothetical protein
LLAALLVAAHPSAQAGALLLGDAAKGQALHAAQCSGCHDHSVYTRADRSVRTVEGLSGRVKMCNTQLKKGLGKDELTDIVKYLNDSFYRF